MTAIELANLSDEEARQLDGAARDFFVRVLTLMNDTGCTVELAYRAVEAAEQEHYA